MRRTVVNGLILAFVLAGVSIALGQQTGAPPEKDIDGPRAVKVTDAPKAKTPAGQSQLEQLLAQALKNNPDIRVATAKATMAEAELNRARLQVTQEVVRLHAALATQQATVNYKTKQLERLQSLSKRAVVDAGQVDVAQQALLIEKGKLAELEAQLGALLGKTPHGAVTDEETLRLRAMEALSAIGTANEAAAVRAAYVRALAQAVKPAGPMADRIRKALEKQVKVNFKELDFPDLMKELEKMAPGLSFRNWMAHSYTGENPLKITLRFDDPVPFATLLQAIEDYFPPRNPYHGVRFMVRDYGILVGGSPPPGAVSVQEFMRQKPAQTGTAAEPASNTGMLWNPPDNIEGTIKQINSGGWLSIAFNGVDGLLSGHTLYVYRPSDGDAKLKYLGTIRIVNVRRKKDALGEYSDAQPVGRFTETPKVGDKVTSRAPDK